MCKSSTTFPSSEAADPVVALDSSVEGEGEGGGAVCCASAPGKVILFGEHAVVYGEPAVAAALSDLRIFVRITPNDETVQQRQRSSKPSMLHVKMYDLPSPVDISFHSDLLRIFNLSEPPTKDDGERIARLLRTLLLSGGHCTKNAKKEEDVGLVLSALTPLVYLLNRVAPATLLAGSGVTVEVRSVDLPVGAGLGSSAAYSVALTAALYRYQQRQQQQFLLLAEQRGEQCTALKRSLVLDTSTNTAKPTTDQLKDINEYAYFSEMLLHGTPSGIDNAVSTYGGAIYFRKESQNRKTVALMEQFTIPSYLELILTHTHVPRSTRILVQHVRDQYESDRGRVESALQAMGDIAREFRKLASAAVVEGKKDPSNGDKMIQLVKKNHDLLREVDVSHPALEKIVETVQEHVVASSSSSLAAATKLTGAGGGGCAMTLLNPNLNEMDTERLSATIQDALEGGGGGEQQQMNGDGNRFTCFQSAVGQDGVLWIDPMSFPQDEFGTTISSRRRSTVHMKGDKDTIAAAAATAAAATVNTSSSTRTSSWWWMMVVAVACLAVVVAAAGGGGSVATFKSFSTTTVSWTSVNLQSSPLPLKEQVLDYAEPMTIPDDKSENRSIEPTITGVVDDGDDDHYSESVDSEKKEQGKKPKKKKLQAVLGWIQKRIPGRRSDSR